VTATDAAPRLAPAALSRATQPLTARLGPIARVLVRRAAAPEEAALWQALAAQI
jgi:hypothetical protein